MERDEACVVCSERDTSDGGARWRRQMLICDRCLDGAHRGCLSARNVMPLDGAWLCPRCRIRGDAVEIGVRSRRRLARLVSATALVYEDEPTATRDVNLDEVPWRWLPDARAAATTSHQGGVESSESGGDSDDSASEGSDGTSGGDASDGSDGDASDADAASVSAVARAVVDARTSKRTLFDLSGVYADLADLADGGAEEGAVERVRSARDRIRATPHEARVEAHTSAAHMLELAALCLEGAIDAEGLALEAAQARSASRASFGAHSRRAPHRAPQRAHRAKAVAEAARLVGSDRAAAARSLVRGAMQAPLEALLASVVLGTLSRDAEFVRFEAYATLTEPELGAPDGPELASAEARRALARHFASFEAPDPVGAETDAWRRHVDAAARYVARAAEAERAEAERAEADEAAAESAETAGRAEAAERAERAERTRRATPSGVRAWTEAFAREWARRASVFRWVRELGDSEIETIVRRVPFLRPLRNMRGTAGRAANRYPAKGVTKGAEKAKAEKAGCTVS